jgi:hypothetical protein
MVEIQGGQTRPFPLCKDCGSKTVLMEGESCGCLSMTRLSGHAAEAELNRWVAKLMWTLMGLAVLGIGLFYLNARMTRKTPMTESTTTLTSTATPLNDSGTHLTSVGGQNEKGN